MAASMYVRDPVEDAITRGEYYRAQELPSSTPTPYRAVAATEKPAYRRRSGGYAEAWMAEAPCREMGPDFFFPGSGEHIAINNARKICVDCPFRTECLDHALENRMDHGIWGGTTRGQRDRVIHGRITVQQALDEAQPKKEKQD